MATPYIGEVRLVGFTFAPPGWLLCNGQILNISDYDPLFALLGNTYGGDGQTTFALPNLQSRVPVHQGNDSMGNTYALAQTGGQESVVLNTSQMATHNHLMQCSTTSANTSSPAKAYPALTSGDNYYTTDSDPGNLTAMAGNGISAMGGSQSHPNIMPFLCLNFMICNEGLYPSAQ